MSDVVVLIAEQSLVVRSALYLASLLFLLVAGGFALSLVVGALDAVGGAVTEKHDWQVFGGLSSKQDVLQLFAMAVYSALLITMEPSIRALASSVGDALVTSLIVAPLVGVTLRERLA
jgi:hypothetical protein